MIYLDHAATTPVNPIVINTMADSLSNDFGNPSSVHHYGRNAHAQLENARTTIAASLNVLPSEIIFTSGGTESDNTAIIGSAYNQRHRGRHIITTMIEHPAVLNTMVRLSTEGFDVTYLPVDERGQLAVEDVINVLTEETILVSIMTANNETGNLLPIAEIGELLKDHQAIFHTDAVQAYGKIGLDPKEMGVDLLSVSGHKINGPKGIGFLYQRNGLNNIPYLFGGEQEGKRRAGTENLAGICGLAKAVELLTPAVQEDKYVEYVRYGQIITSQLAKHNIHFKVNGDVENKLPHVLNLWLYNVPNDLLLLRLDFLGTAISTGSACTAGNVEPSHVLSSMYGQYSPALKESIRISFGLGNTREEINRFSEQLISLAHELKQKSEVKI